jgi:hypothetical protein
MCRIVLDWIDPHAPGTLKLQLKKRAGVSPFSFGVHLKTENPPAAMAKPQNCPFPAGFTGWRKQCLGYISIVWVNSVEKGDLGGKEILGCKAQQFVNRTGDRLKLQAGTEFIGQFGFLD